MTKLLAAALLVASMPMSVAAEKKIIYPTEFREGMPFSPGVQVGDTLYCAGQTGSGLEMAGGFRAVGGPVRIDAQGRILVLHSAAGYEERGLGVTISVGNQTAQEGLSFSVSPRWGGPTTASGVLWEERLGGLFGPGPSGPVADRLWSLDARGRYAVLLPGGRLLAWSGGLNRSARGWGITIGGGIETARAVQPARQVR